MKISGKLYRNAEMGYSGGMRILLAPLLVFALAGSSHASPAGDDYYWYSAANDAKPRPWAILFPRAAGIGKLEPGNQYVEFAMLLNANGIDALVIDYDRAAKKIGAKGKTGEKLAAIARDALADYRSKDRMDVRCPGLAVGWSRGGEGALTLASAAEGGTTGVKAAIVYYPSVRGQSKPYVQLHPILALQGDSDALAPHVKLQELAESRTDKTIVFQIELYPGAGHRFDLAKPIENPSSAETPKDYAPAAAEAARKSIETFLNAQGIAGSSCALD